MTAKPTLWKRLDLDWLDLSGLLVLIGLFVSLSALVSWAWGLLVVSVVLGVVVMLLTLRKPRGRTDGRI